MTRAMMTCAALLAACCVGCASTTACKEGKDCCKGDAAHAQMCPDCKDGQKCEACKAKMTQACPDCKDGQKCEACKAKTN